MLIQLPGDVVSREHKEVGPFHHEQVFHSASAGASGRLRRYINDNII